MSGNSENGSEMCEKKNYANKRMEQVRKWNPKGLFSPIFLNSFRNKYLPTQRRPPTLIFNSKIHQLRAK